jgi:hypothetical protein
MLMQIISNVNMNDKQNSCEKTSNKKIYWQVNVMVVLMF